MGWPGHHTTPDHQFGAALTASRQTETGTQNGGYLESSLCMPCLTRTSAALPCS